MQNHLISSDVNLCKTFKVLLHMKCECCINTDVKKKLFSVKLLFIRSKINFHTYPFWNISWFVAAWIYLLASLCSRATAFVYHIRVSCSKPNWQLLQHSSFMGATTSNVRWVGKCRTGLQQNWAVCRYFSCSPMYLCLFFDFPFSVMVSIPVLF